MGEVILHPSHEGYCKECIFRNPKNGTCSSEEYNRNAYKVCCVWGYCKYKRKKRKEE